MEPVRVDQDCGIRLSVLTPGDYYEPEVLGPDEIRLHRVKGRPFSNRISREESLAAIERTGLKFKLGWEDLRGETRE